MFFVITNIYKKKTKGPTLMELFTATGKLFFFNYLFFFLQLEMFDVCTTGDTAHIDTIFKFLLHTCPSKTMGMFCGNSSFAQTQYNVQNVCANQT